MSEVIVIEGNMGIGKTTMAYELGRAIGGRVLEEPVDENPYLEHFYKSPKKYAYEMQTWILLRRFQLHRQAQMIAHERSIPVIIDRSIFGDTLFAKVAYKRGFMSDLQYASYSKIKATLLAEVNIPDSMIFLEAPIGIVMDRIQMRARGCETSVTWDYVEDLEVEYQCWLSEIIIDPKFNTHRIDHSRYAHVSEIVKQLRIGNGELTI